MTTTIKIQAPVKLRPGPWTTTATPVSMTLPLPVSSTWRIYAVTIHLEYQGVYLGWSRRSSLRLPGWPVLGCDPQRCRLTDFGWLPSRGKSDGCLAC